MTAPPLHRLLFLGLVSLAGPASLLAQFSPSLLQNNSYWGDGKAEVDLYDAQIMREGQPRHCEMTLILMRDTFTPQVTVSRTPSKAEAISGIRMSQIFTAPIGLGVEQHSLSLFWNGAADLLAGSLVTATGRGNRVVQAEGLPENRSLCTEVRNERGEVGTLEFFFPKSGAAVLYDELPLRVRTIAFTKPAAEFEFQMAAPLASPGQFKTSKASYKVNERAIEVEVRDGQALDRFLLDREFPFLMREWKTRDGSQFKLKNSLKADFWNYSKDGDRERALQDPMLRHPD